MTLFLTDTDVRATFDWGEAIAALRSAYSAPPDEARFPARSIARGEGLWLRTLSGVPGDGSPMGAKLIAASTRNRLASYLIPLFDQETVELTALLDGHSITGYRTAATSALAADVLAPPGPLRAAVIGSGFEAQNHVRALAAIRTLSAVTVFSPNPASRLRFTRELADLNVPLATADSAEAAVDGADLVICAARSRDEQPTLRTAPPGTTIVSIGSTLPEQREVGVEVVAQATVIVADMPDEVDHDTGDLIAAKDAGVAFADKLVPLADVVAGRTAGRPAGRPDAVVLYKSVGSAVQDLAVAAMCARRAAELSIGTTLPVTLSPVPK
ncbi:ornithine cyclodeaminase family protein [Streptomyces rishiriensis]|uniref:Alanine dehydrogenase n=1 Tax=Streptomyces rishiriensis TaxID=68264 RepID=A0ABU0NHB3_STRRH|nr:ornithine cyclodeaminase family protein [Streptomyces rishiriensis]MDQ0578022.1 alanine dehydrogenase [Streptomyces rishiriensis]